MLLEKAKKKKKRISHLNIKIHLEGAKINDSAYYS